VEKTEQQWDAEQKQKEIITNYQYMTKENAERYLAVKNGEYRTSTTAELFLTDAWGTWS